MRILCLLLFIIYGCNLARAADQPMLYITTGQWPPYLDKSRSDLGCTAKFIRDAFATQGYRVRFIFMPWERAYVEGQKDGFAASAYWLDKPERRRDYLYTKNPVTLEHYYFYSHARKPLAFKTFDDLKNYSLILNKGFTYPQPLMEAIEKHDIKVNWAVYATKNLKLLTVNRGDVTILADGPADTYLNSLSELQRSQIIKYPDPAYTQPSFLLVNKQHPEIAAIFDNGFLALAGQDDYLEQYQQKCSPLF